METLELLKHLVQTVEAETYSQYETIARTRMDRRDLDDLAGARICARVGLPDLD